MSALHIRVGNETALPFDALLAVIPSLPRPVLARLTQRMIERMDDLDGDADTEDDDPPEDDDDDTGVEDNPQGFDPEEDCCVAGDDRVMAGYGIGYPVKDDYGPGDPEDAEAGDGH